MMVDTPRSRSSLRRVQLARKRWEEHKILLHRNGEGTNDTLNRMPRKEDSNGEDTLPGGWSAEGTRKETTTLVTGQDGLSLGHSNKETQGNVGFPSLPVKSSAPFTFSAPTKTASGGGFSFSAAARKRKDEKTDSATPPGSGAFPPLATTVPVASGGKKSPENRKGAPFSSASPLSSKTPVDSISDGVKPTSGAAGVPAFPPMSTKAPTPFSQGKSSSKKVDTSTSAAFPPMSLVAPSNPFSKKAETQAAVSANPAAERRKLFVRSKPKPQEQPTNLNPFAKLNLSSSSSNAKPAFSFGGQKVATTGSISADGSKGAESFSFSFGGPKIAGGVAASSTEVKAAANSGNISGQSKTASGGGFSFGKNASVSPSSSKSPVKPVSDGVKPAGKPAGESAFPPMSTKAPTPFSQGKSSSKKVDTSTSAAFPPMSLVAPSNPFSKKAETKAVGSANPAVEPLAKLNLSSSSSSNANAFSFGGQEVAATGSLSADDSRGAGGFSFSFGGSKTAGGGLASSVVAASSTEVKAATSSAAADQPQFYSFAGAGAQTSGAANADSSFSSIPKPAQPTSTNASASAADYKSKLTEFYKEHNPEKLAMVDSNLAKYLGKEDELFRKLYAKYGLTQDGETRSPFPHPVGSGPRCFLELSVGGQPVGRVNIQLFTDKTPITANNFLGLCTGSWVDEGGNEQVCKTFVKNCFHRVVPGMCLQGGDITLGNGRGGRSIYPANNPTFGTDAWGKFRDETPFMSHSKRGLLSMANAGANQNGSQFFITLKELPYLNGKHVVFGKVLDADMKVLDRVMDLVEVDPKLNHLPKGHCKVVIEACGQA